MPEDKFCNVCKCFIDESKYSASPSIDGNYIHYDKEGCVNSLLEKIQWMDGMATMRHRWVTEAGEQIEEMEELLEENGIDYDRPE